MKIKIVIVCIAFLFFRACDSHAEVNRILVVPFESEVEKKEVISERMTEAAVAEVKAAGGVVYVTGDQFFEEWLKDGILKDWGIVGVEQMYALLIPMLEPDGVGVIPEHKGQWKADFIISGARKKKVAVAELYMQIVSIDTGCFFAVTDVFNPEQAQKTVRRQVRTLLGKLEAVRKVNADTIVNPAMSTVQYDIASMEGEDIYITADYTSTRPNPPMQNASINAKTGLKDGEKVLRLRSRENRNIDVGFLYKNGKQENAWLNTNSSQCAQDAGFQETLSVVSKMGYVLNFTFEWSKGKLQGVKVDPLVHPYGEIR